MLDLENKIFIALSLFCLLQFPFCSKIFLIFDHSLRELNNISLYATSTPKMAQHYLLSPHLIRRKIHQHYPLPQQQQANNQSGLVNSQINSSYINNTNYNPSFKITRLMRTASNNNDHNQPNNDLNNLYSASLLQTSAFLSSLRSTVQ